MDKHSGFFIFLATLLLAIITGLYLEETYVTRKLLQHDLYRRSVPTIAISTPTNFMDNDQIKTIIKIKNSGATADDESIAIFWSVGNKFQFDVSGVSLIEGTQVPLYRYKLHHPTGLTEKIITEIPKTVNILLPIKNRLEEI